MWQLDQVLTVCHTKFEAEYMTGNYHIEILLQEFERRKSIDQNYSLRRFGKCIGIHYSTLSKILKGERGIPLPQIEEILKRLDLPQEVSQKFQETALKTKGINKKPRIKTWAVLNDRLHYKIIAEWEYYAVYFLFDLEDFEFDPEWMAKKLSVSVARIKEVLFDLTSLGLLVQDQDGTWSRREPNLTTADDVLSQALRESYKQDMKRAERCIESTPLFARGFHSMVIPTNPKQLEKAKRITRHYLDEMSDLLSSGDKSELYQVNVQIFPVTNLDTKSRGHS